MASPRTGTESINALQGRVADLERRLKDSESLNEELTAKINSSTPKGGPTGKGGQADVRAVNSDGLIPGGPLMTFLRDNGNGANRAGEDERTGSYGSNLSMEQEAADLSPNARSRLIAALTPSEFNLNTDEANNLEMFYPRVKWLLGLLIFQSTSSFILRLFQDLIHSHPSIVFFLTMLVGAGGNAGGQSVVLAVRKLALNQPMDNGKQLFMAGKLALTLSIATAIRTGIQQITSFWSSVSLSISMFCIVYSAVCVGTFLPQIFQRLGIDPAHASAAIQVCMDVIGTISPYNNLPLRTE